MRKLHRHVSRRFKGSNNWSRTRVQLTVGYERVANQRRDYAYRVARSMVNRYEKIVVEDLKIGNMVRNCLARGSQRGRDPSRR